MIGSKDVYVNYMKEAIKTGEAIGFEKATEILIALRNSNSTSIYNDSVELVVNEVLLHFKMTKSQLLEKRGDSRLARRFCYVLLQHFLDINIHFLTNYFNRSNKSVYLEIKLFNDLERANKVDIMVLERYDCIHSKIGKKLRK